MFLQIVRRINMLVKSKYKPGKTGFLRKEVLDVLLVLRIKEADLEKEKEEESTSGRKMTFEQRKMLSKRQRKVWTVILYLFANEYDLWIIATLIRICLCYNITYYYLCFRKPRN